MRYLFRTILDVRPLGWTAVAIAVALTSWDTSFGQMNFWLSTTGDVTQGSAAGEVPDVRSPRGSSGMIHVWAKPDTNKNLESFALNLVSTSETAIEFTSAEVINDGRFGFVFDTNNGLDIADQSICIFPAPQHGIWGLSGISITPESATGLNAAAPGEDAFYDSVNQSWLLASIGYSALANGATDLFLEVGQIGMNYEGESAESLSVGFGALSDPKLGNGFEDRCTRSLTADATVSVIDPIVGDFNSNGELDAGDIDLLSIEVVAGTNAAAFDLTGVNSVDQEDRVYWVETLKGTHFGDVDLDGLVNFTDFLALSGAFGKSLGWAHGDMDGNQFVDFADFLSLSGNFGEGELFEVQTVPEPQGPWTLLGLLGSCGWLSRRCRRERTVNK